MLRNIRWEIIAAAVVIAAAIYFKPPAEPPRYAMTTTQFGLFRIDTKTGQVVTCTVQGCENIAPAEDEVTQLDRVMAEPIKNSE